MHVYLVAYDVADDDRRADIADVCASFGRRIQYSVFECLLGETGFARLLVDLEPLVHHDADQVLVFDLGPLEGRGASAVRSLGKPYSAPSTKAIVV